MSETKVGIHEQNQPRETPEEVFNEQNSEPGISMSPVGATPPPLQKSTGKLIQLANKTSRQIVFRSIQRTYGNAYASQVANNFNATKFARKNEKAPAFTILRHPEDAELLANKDEAVQQITNPSSNGAANNNSSAAAPTSSAASTATPDTSTTPSSDTEGQAATGEAPAPSAEPPVPGTSLAMDLAKAQSVLQKVYGSKHKIVPGNITLLDNKQATWDKYDEVSIRDKVGYTPPGGTLRIWQAGDAKVRYPGGLNGFADDKTGTVYVSKETSSPTTTCHEMMHLNTAAGFRKTVGETLNEGTTQILTVKALKAEGVTLPATLPYETEMSWARKLIAVIGEDLLTNAYFNGPGDLVTNFDNLQGKSMFLLLKGALDSKNDAAADTVLTPPSAAKKAQVINGILDEWWTTDNDLDIIASIFNTNEADKPTIRTAVQPKISSLTDLGQRTRLRVILGTV